MVGLGNPGEEYERTRHNLGAEVVEAVAARRGQRLRPEKGTRAVVAQSRLDGRLVVLAVPQTYMNESGLAAVALMKRFRVPGADRLVVVHDELDLPSGRVKVKVGGGTAGNNGLKSIHAHLHDPGYLRIRIGIGKSSDAYFPDDAVRVLGAMVGEPVSAERRRILPLQFSEHAARLGFGCR